MNRGRIAPIAASASSLPLAPVTGKLGTFYWGADLSSGASWTPRVDTLAAGPITGVNTTVSTTTQGSYACMECLSASSAYLRLDSLVSMFTGDDPNWEIVILYENISAGASNTIMAASSSSSTSPKRVVTYTTGPYRFVQQTTTSVFGHNATNTSLQMLRIRSKNNGAGTDLTIWRNEEPDPINGFWGNGTLTQNVGSQACDRFLFGAQWNGGGGPVNFNNWRVAGIWIRNPAAAELTDDEGVELHNWFLGYTALNALYASAPATQYFLCGLFGQSNMPWQGLVTGATLSGIPDATAKTFVRSLNNDADNPVALRALDRRAGANSYSGSAQHIISGSFAMQHHFFGVGKGATNAGSDWGGGNGAGPTNSLQGFLSTELYSECRRNIFLTKALFGGAPIVQAVWQQGENDAAAGAVVAGQYGTNFGSGTVNILLYLRLLIQRVWAVSNAVCHAVQLNPNQTGGGIVLADLNTIRAAMVTLDAGDANLYLVETNDITDFQAGNLHYNDTGYTTIASRVITSIKASNGAL